MFSLNSAKKNTTPLRLKYGKHLKVIFCIQKDGTLGDQLLGADLQ